MLYVNVWLIISQCGLCVSYVIDRISLSFCYSKLYDVMNISISNKMKESISS